MLSKNKIKLIHSLDTKKGRKQEGAFVAEGFKCVGDLLREGFHARCIIATEEWLCSEALPQNTELIRVTEEELRKASLLQHPQQVIGIFDTPQDTPQAPRKGGCLPATQDGTERSTVSKDTPQAPRKGGCLPATQDGTERSTVSKDTPQAPRKGGCLSAQQSFDGITQPSEVTSNIPPNGGLGGYLGRYLGGYLTLCLDGVQDPGNLGTIIRTADWFGIRNIVCSHDTADAFNPKVVQATMGSISRVHIYYTDLVPFLKALPQDTPIYGTLLDGDNLYNAEIQNHGIIVMGNEGNGISPEVRKLLTHHLLIPSYPPDATTAESLNVSIATAIILAEFRRRG